MYQIGTIDRAGGDQIRDAEGESRRASKRFRGYKDRRRLPGCIMETREHFHSVPNLWKFVETWGHRSGRQKAICGNVEIFVEMLYIRACRTLAAYLWKCLWKSFLQIDGTFLQIEFVEMLINKGLLHFMEIICSKELRHIKGIYNRIKKMAPRCFYKAETERRNRRGSSIL